MGRRKDKKQQQQQHPQTPSKRAGRGHKAGDWRQTPEWKQFGAQLQARGLVLRDTEGDGNCLFRSLADQLYGDEARHLLVRQSIVAFLLAQPDEFSPFLVDDE